MFISSQTSFYKPHYPSPGISKMKAPSKKFGTTISIVRISIELYADLLFVFCVCHGSIALLLLLHLNDSSMFNGGHTSHRSLPLQHLVISRWSHLNTHSLLTPTRSIHRYPQYSWSWSWWIHDPTDTMGWFPSPFSTYLSSDSMANAVFDHNYVNNNQILLNQRQNLSPCRL